MFPKGKLLALLAVFAAIALITASGAFTTVQADRQADVGVAGDSAALLQIVPSDASSFAQNQSNGEVEINLGSSGEGVNANATTLEDSTLNITNNGEEPVNVHINATTQNNTENVTFYVDNSSGQLASNTADATTLGDHIDYIGEDRPVQPSLSNRYVLNSTTNSVELTSGADISVGIYIETHGPNATNSSSNIFIDEDAITVVAQDEEGAAMTAQSP